jgi:hypothetical protein
MLDRGDHCRHSVSNQGLGRSLPGPGAGHPLHRAGGHDDEDQGAEVPGVEREWEPRGSHGNERLPDCLETRTADRDAPEVTD